MKNRRTSNPQNEGKRLPHTKRHLIRQWRKKFSQLQVQLILPYVFLTVITASVGIFIVSNFITNTIQERFSNHLIETSRVASDELVRIERGHLENLRQIVFTDGISEAVSGNDSHQLETLVFPIMANEALELLSVINTEGLELITLIGNVQNNSYTRSEGFDLSSIQVLDQAIAGDTDDLGDKYVAFETINGEIHFLTAAPIVNSNGEIIGAIMVGSRLSGLASLLKTTSLAEIVFLSAQGKILESSLAEPDEGYQLLELAKSEISSFDRSLTKNLSLFGRDFRLLFSPFITRSETQGYLGVALPMNYIITTSFNSRLILSVIFTLSTIGVIIVGTIISNRLVRPISQLRDVTMEVAAGDFYKKTNLRRSDEIGQLASVFDLMTARLRRRDREAGRLYTNLAERTEEISEANTKLQNSQQQLVQSEKLSSIGQLIAGIVHDIKTPLGVIMFAAEELQTMLPGDKHSDEYFRILKSSAEKANTIISDLLKFARQSEPEKSVQDLIQTVGVALRLTDYERKKSKVELDISEMGNSLLANFDARQIEGVLINLITNAVYAMPNGGSLKLNVFEDEKINIIVSDTGGGIHSEMLRKIFDPFFTTKPEGEGTGLGLSVAYGIINDHGGSIDVESNLGSGTSFHIKLPLLRSDQKKKYLDKFPPQKVNGNGSNNELSHQELSLVSIERQVENSSGEQN